MAIKAETCSWDIICIWQYSCVKTVIPLHIAYLWLTNTTRMTHLEGVGGSSPHFVLLSLIGVEIHNGEWKMERWKVKSEWISSIHFKSHILRAIKDIKQCLFVTTLYRCLVLSCLNAQDYFASFFGTRDCQVALSCDVWYDLMPIVLGVSVFWVR